MVKEWLYPLVDPLMVDATIHVSYLVFPDRDLRVYEVVLAGTVMSANSQNKTHNNRTRPTRTGVGAGREGGIRTVEVGTTRVEDGVVGDEASASVGGDFLPHQLCLVMSRFVFDSHNGAI